MNEGFFLSLQAFFLLPSDFRRRNIVDKNVLRKKHAELTQRAREHVGERIGRKYFSVDSSCKDKESDVQSAEFFQDGVALSGAVILVLRIGEA